MITQIPKRSLSRSINRRNHGKSGRRKWILAAAAAAACGLPAQRAAAQTWNGGAGNWSTPGNWSGGVVPNTPTNVVFIDGGNALASNVTLDVSESIRGLTLDAGDTLRFGGSSLSFTLNGGGATINGLLDIANGTNNFFNSTLAFAGTSAQSLGGIGQVSLGTNTAGATFIANNAGANLLTIGPGLLIHGKNATFSGNSGGILNQGTIAADVAGGGLFTLNGMTNAGTISGTTNTTLTTTNLQNAASGTVTTTAGTITLNGTWHNAGVINSINGTVNLGGTFVFGDVGTLNRTGGTVNITGTLNNTGSTLTLDATTGSWGLAGGTIQGGTVSASGGSQLLINNTATLDGVTLNSSVIFTGSSLNVNVVHGLTLGPGVVLDIANGTNNFFNSTLSFNGTSAQTLGGVGQVSLGTNAGTSFLSNTSGTNLVTIGPGILVHGKSVNFNGNSGVFLNQGTIAADVPGGTYNLNLFTNAASVTGASNTTLTFTGFQNAASGTVTTTAGTITLNGTWHNAGVINSINGTVNLGGSFVFGDLGTLNRVGGAVNITGTLNNTGNTLTLDATTGSWGLTGGTIQGGTVSASGGSQLLINNSGTLDGVTLNSSVAFTGSSLNVNVVHGLTLGPGVVLDIANGTNNFFNSTLSFNGTSAQTLGGVGQVSLGTNSAGASFLSNNSGTNLVTIGPGILIHGKSLNFNGNNGGFFNQGTIAADVPGGAYNFSLFTNAASVTGASNTTLTFTGFQNAASGTVTTTAGTITLNGTWHNAGAINSINGTVNLGGGFVFGDLGTLNRTGGTVNITGNLTNTGSTLALNATTGSWVLSGGGSILGGSVSASAGSQLLIAGGTLDGVTLNSSGAFTGFSETLTLPHGLTLGSGAVLDVANGTNNFFNSNLTFSGTSAQTLGGSGQVSFGTNNAGASFLFNNSGTNLLTIGPGILVHGKNGSLIGNSGGIVNQGTIAADIAGGSFTFSGPVTNTGTVQGLNGGSLSFQNSFIQTAGLLGGGGDLANAGLLQVNGGTVSLGAVSGNTGTTILGSIAPGPTQPMTVKSITQNTLTIHNTGILTVPMTTNRVSSNVPNFSLDGNGTFDLGNSELATLTAPATIRGYLTHAYDPNGNADWGQPGLTSGFAKGNPTSFSVGYAFGGDQSAKDAGVRLHDGTLLATNQTVVRPVLTGDANMDGTVDFFDITQLLGYKYNTGQAASYTDGDLDYSGKVDFFDITVILSANYNTGQHFGPASATPTLTGGHSASPTGVIAAATTIGVSGDGKPDFEYDPATGHLRFRTDGGVFTTTGGTSSFVSSLTISSASGILISGGASPVFSNGTGATLTANLLSSALTNTPGFSDGFDIGIVLAPGLDAAALAADLTVKYQSLNGGALKIADITLIPEPTSLTTIGVVAAAAFCSRRRRRRHVDTAGQYFA
jgi:hypothetical protein